MLNQNDAPSIRLVSVLKMQLVLSYDAQKAMVAQNYIISNYVESR